VSRDPPQTANVIGSAKYMSLGLAGTSLSELPAAKLTAELTSIDASDNSLTVLPAEIGNCENLEELLLFANSLKVGRGLPKELGNASCRS
jgi:hypothetical protein